MGSIDWKIIGVMARLDGWNNSLDTYLSAGPSSPVRLSLKSHMLSKNYVAKKGDYRINVTPLLQDLKTQISLSPRTKEEGGFEDFNNEDLEGFREVMEYVNNLGMGYQQIIDFEKGKSTVRARFYKQPANVTVAFEKEKRVATRRFLDSIRESTKYSDSILKRRL